MKKITADVIKPIRICVSGFIKLLFIYLGLGCRILNSKLSLRINTLHFFASWAFYFFAVKVWRDLHF
jgi:hypothetical protein